MRLGRLDLWQWSLRPQRTLLELMLADEVGCARLRRALTRLDDLEHELAPEETPLATWDGLRVVLARWTLDEHGVIGPEDLDALGRRGHIGEVLCGVSSRLADGRPMPLLRVRFADGYVLWAWKCDLLIPGERENEDSGRAG